MTWREKMVMRILLVIAKMLAEDNTELKGDIRHMYNSIYNAPNLDKES